jgi:hypothetical protein
MGCVTFLTPCRSYMQLTEKQVKLKIMKERNIIKKCPLIQNDKQSWIFKDDIFNVHLPGNIFLREYWRHMQISVPFAQGRGSLLYNDLCMLFLQQWVVKADIRNGK